MPLLLKEVEEEVGLSWDPDELWNCEGPESGWGASSADSAGGGRIWLAQSLEPATPDLGVVSLSTTLGIEILKKKKKNLKNKRKCEGQGPEGGLMLSLWVGGGRESCPVLLGGVAEQSPPHGGAGAKPTSAALIAPFRGLWSHSRVVFPWAVSPTSLAPSPCICTVESSVPALTGLVDTGRVNICQVLRSGAGLHSAIAQPMLICCC